MAKLWIKGFLILGLFFSIMGCASRTAPEPQSKTWVTANTTIPQELQGTLPPQNGQ